MNERIGGETCFADWTVTLHAGRSDRLAPQPLSTKTSLICTTGV
jgi:hypothetical protein